nr:hypothetical protein [Halapricum sp. CBA1109]
MIFFENEAALITIDFLIVATGNDTIWSAALRASLFGTLNDWSLTGLYLLVVS